MALAPSSLKAYNAQLASFLTHSRLTRKQLYNLPALHLDRALALYIQHCYDSSTPFQYAAHALHAVVFHRLDLNCIKRELASKAGSESRRRSRILHSHGS